MNTYAAFAHKGPRSGQTFEAESLWPAKVEAARLAGVKTQDVSVQLQVTADGRDVVGAIL